MSILSGNDSAWESPETENSACGDEKLVRMSIHHGASGARQLLEGVELVRFSHAAEASPERRDQDLARQQRVLDLVAAGDSRHAVLDGLCLLIEDIIEHSMCSILLLNQHGTRFRHVAGPSLSPKLMAAMNGEIAEELANGGPDVRPLVDAFSRGDAAIDTPVAQLARVGSDLGQHVWLTAPIIDASSGNVAGVIVVYHQDASRPSDMQKARVRQAAEIASRALQTFPEDQTRPNVAPSASGEVQSLAQHAAVNNDSFRQIVETIPAITYALLYGDAPTVTYVSPRVEEILGLTPRDYVAHPKFWLTLVHPVDQDRVRVAVARSLATQEPLDVEYRVIAKNGRAVWLRDMAVPIEKTSARSQLWHGVQIDITEKKAAESELHHLAYYDSLTGLPNRRLCIDRLEAILGHADRSPIALLFLDLDRFKIINDGIGHAAGDELLVAVAQRLSAHVGGQAALARFGGDEFVVVLEDFSQSGVETMAATMLDSLRIPFHVKGYELTVEGTIGVAIASPELSTPDLLLRAADIALYRAKAEGRGIYAVYDPRADVQSLDRIAGEAELRRALEHEEFQVAYQPVVDIRTRTILAVEALVRWNHPERGMLYPADFIRLADETGLIVPLGNWVINEACRQMRQWQDRYPAARQLHVSVNLSPRQFRQAGLADDVARALGESGLSPLSLALEIKENDALADWSVIAAAMNDFKRLGVKVTIDEFGKGSTVLGSLTRFSIDDLKIDGSCVSTLEEHQHEVDTVRALVSMAKAIGMKVTAGAVESSEQLALLEEMGFDRAQGRHLAPPFMVIELEAIFQRSTSARLSVDEMLPPTP